MNKAQTLKRNLMIMVFFIIMLSGIFISYYQHNLIKGNFDNRIKTLDHNIHNSFNVILNHISYDISMKTDSLLELDGLTKIFAQQDRDKLLDMVLPIYKRMSKQNPYLKIMTFRLTDGSTFLRVHKPAMYGDKLNKKRKIIIDTNRLKKRHLGFEVGKLKMTYRIVTPIFYKSRHIGLVEIGIEPEFITNRLNKLFNIKKGLLVKKENISVPLDKSKNSTISDFIFVRGDKLFQNHLKDIVLDIHTRVTTDEGNSFIINSDLNLLDHKNNIAAKLLLAYNIDKYLEEINVSTKDLVIHMSILMFILMFILNYFINLFTKQINSLNLDLIEKTDELEQTVQEKTKLSETIFYKSVDSLSIIEDGKFINCNDALLKMLKYKSKKDFLNTSPSSLSPKYQPDGQTSEKKAEKMMVKTFGSK